MSAWTRLRAKLSETLLTAVNLPYIAVRRSVSIRITGSAMAAPPHGDPRAQAQYEHHQDEHQRGGPGVGMPLLEWPGRVGEHGEWQGGHRLVDAGHEVLAAQRREEQWCRFAGHARHRQQAAGDDARQGGAHHRRNCLLYTSDAAD